MWGPYESAIFRYDGGYVYKKKCIEDDGQIKGIHSVKVAIQFKYDEW